MKRSASYKHVAGAAELSAALRALPDDMRKTILVQGVKAAIQPILTAAKRFAKRSEDTGALRESLTTKTKAYPNTGKAVGLVGPDRAYYRKGKKTGKLGALYANRRPANYAHLVEYGHAIVAPKAGTSRRKKTAVDIRDSSGASRFVAPRPFIRPAVVTTHDQQAQEFYKGIASGFEKTRRRMMRAGTHKA